MKICLIAVGTRMPAWVLDGYQEYAKRMPKELKPELVELPLAVRSKSTNTQNAIASEGDNMLKHLSNGSRTIALDVLGKPVSTEQLSQKMADWQMDGRNVNIIIGGPDGLDARCLAQADEKWSLSALTLPHPLVRVLLIEQLYRAWTILQNHPYHK